MHNLPFRSAKALVSSIRRKKIGCLELLDLYLSRIERYNPRINAVIFMNIDEARRRARLADRALAKGEIWGPLHGLPMTVKESYDAVGMPTTWVVPAHRNNYPEKNALAVDRFPEAGAVLFGKTNVPLYFADWQSFNEIYGTTNNPPKIDSPEAYKKCIRLLRSATCGRLTPEEFRKDAQAAEALDPADDRYQARALRAQAMPHWNWLAENETRHRMRLLWADFFRESDLLLCPIATTAAFPHNQKGERWERMVRVNGKPQPSTTQMFWAGYSCNFYLPSTVAPAGFTREGLPVGVQIVGPQCGDLTCTHFARVLEEEFQGFVPPPGYE